MSGSSVTRVPVQALRDLGAIGSPGCPDRPCGGCPLGPDVASEGVNDARGQEARTGDGGAAIPRLAVFFVPLPDPVPVPHATVLSLSFELAAEVPQLIGVEYGRHLMIHRSSTVGAGLCRSNLKSAADA